MSIKAPETRADERLMANTGEVRAMSPGRAADQSIRRRPPSGATATVLSGFYEGLEVSLDRDRIVIGRGRKADLALAEATISRAHAAIGFDGQRFFVEDLGSTNGTLVNGAKISRRALASDDEIQMGKLRIAVSLPD